MTRSNWRSAASCRGLDVETFYPLPEDQATIRTALSVCSRCPVRTPCRRHALSRKERYGIWGGLTEAAREAIMRRSQATGAGFSQMTQAAFPGPPTSSTGTTFHRKE
ncbi:WhiB family transcriptional regulator [Streptomyces griseorubiginosus]|uniref:WhiB family transcriptional regulator n=1 Tax=Streptomyces griseorubiginosus TaxID=67304 RepID=UPI001AD6934F|nr:WhiB family transcriptional regulator [Streptomyces griseorubiginosus]MBO4252447.1 WhiB family transcriptional regulator [Streptomyces griseorubiginosus]